MAYMQRTRILSDSDLDDAATWRERIDLAGKVTAIEMRINCDRYATRADNDAVYPLESCISKIELLQDATHPLISLSGQQIDAMNYWDFKRPNARRYRQEASTGNDVILFLMGGRSLYDRQYGFDFDKLKKVYLEYTYNLHEGTAEYFKANDHDIKLYAWQWMGPGLPNFSHYFRARQLDSWTTTAAAAEHKVEIASGHPVRRIGVQATTRTATLGGTFTSLDLQVGKGEYSPVVIKSPMDWAMAEVAEYGLSNIVGGIDYCIASTEMDLPYWFSYIETVMAQSYGASGLAVPLLAGITLPPRVAAASAVAGEVMFTERGWGFQKCLRIGFDHEDDGYDLLVVPSNKALDLVCTEAAASKAANVFVQDVIPY